MHRYQITCCCHGVSLNPPTHLRTILHDGCYQTGGRSIGRSGNASDQITHYPGHLFNYHTLCTDKNTSLPYQWLSIHKNRMMMVLIIMISTNDFPVSVALFFRTDSPISTINFQFVSISFIITFCGQFVIKLNHLDTALLYRNNKGYLQVSTGYHPWLVYYRHVS